MENTLEKKTFNVVGAMSDGYDKILTEDAMKFICMLEDKFGQTRLDLLSKREDVQKNIDLGEFPNFLKETENIRQGDWT